MDLVVGTVVAGRFRLERPLGKGGMGAVWVARHLSLDIPCALKFLHAEVAEGATIRARFEREAKAAAQIRSPNVVQILDHGVWEDIPFIAMELLDGHDLEHRLAHAGTLTPYATMQIVDQVARALSKAHAAGLVHRDLKPANIFLVRDEDREIAKVLDFGIAKRTGTEVDDARTKTGTIMGTPHYMSPEQARGLKEVDHRTDLWALGVIAFQCLVGRLPFVGTALGDIFMKIMAEPIPRPSLLAPVPPPFDMWWARAAERDPNRRFQSAREMADALAVALGLSVNITDPSLRFSSPPSNLGTLPLIPPVSARVLQPAPVTPREGSSAPTYPAASAPAVTPPPDLVSQTASAVATEAASVRSRKPASQGAAVALIAGLGLVVAGGGAVAYLRLGPKHRDAGAALVGISAALPPAAPPPTAPLPVVVPAAPAPEAVRTVQVAIAPANAQVWVDAVVVSPVNGVVAITGTLGSAHLVRIASDGKDTTAEVTVAEAGAVPARVELSPKEVAAKKDPSLTAKPIAKTSQPQPTPPSSPAPPKTGLDRDFH